MKLVGHFASPALTTTNRSRKGAAQLKPAAALPVAGVKIR